MNGLKSFTLAFLFGVVAIWMTVVPAKAATVIIGDFGKLTGAKNVDVLGISYDVNFLEGSCRSLFDGCDQLSDFTFQSLPTAAAAAAALFEQVFLDIGVGQEFDSQPTLTFGCPGDVTLCISFIPYATRIVSGLDYFVRAEARNFSAAESNSAEPSDAVTVDSALDIEFSTVGGTLTARKANFAVFAPSPVPIPAALPLFLSGLGLLGFVGWRRKRGVN